VYRTAALALVLAVSLDPVHAWGQQTAEATRWSSVVPRPSDADPAAGVWAAPEVVRVSWGALDAPERTDLADRIDKILTPLGRRWRPALRNEAADLVFAPGPSGEAYQLTVDPEGVTVAAADPAGRFYALVTLGQLLPSRARTVEPALAAAGRITDAPAFLWRGLMLDSARHLQSVNTIEWVLELMAQHKLNRFHWHLTDDQGWRFEVPGWPRLTEVGAWRTEADGTRYGGFFSNADIRRIVASATRRHIVIVPEVDLPGHATAALAAYPELSASGLGRPVATDWAVADGVLSVGKASVQKFTGDVLSALSGLFPGPYIHWGGDEVFRYPYLRNAESLAWMKSVKATTGDEALAAFWTDLARRTLAAGKVPIGWDEAALYSAPAGTVVQWWDDPSRGRTALEAGHPVIASWKVASYLDYPEWPGDPDRAWWMPVQSLNTIAAQPLWPAGTSESARKLLWGVEATLFTERVSDARIGRKLFPRLALVADLAWTGVPGGAPGWQARIEGHRDRLEAWGVGMPSPAR